MEQRFVVAVDGSETALRALDVAIELAQRLGADIVLCHIIDAARAARLTFGEPALIDGCYDALRSDGEYYLDQAMQRLHLSKVAGSTVLAYGDPATELERVVAAKKATMIIMGTHGRTGLRHLVMGSVAEGVMRHAAVPVVVVPQEEQRKEQRTVA